MKVKKELIGYFDNAEQLEPAYDPGLAIDCLICNFRLSKPVKTISLLKPGDPKSYFYRTHKSCYENLSATAITDLDSTILSDLN